MWNRAVSERLKTFGREVLVGDLVAGKGANLEEEAEPGEDDVDNGKDEKAEQPVEEKKQQEKKANELIEVTEENKANYTLEDVVMPLIGHEVELPKNEKLREIFETLLKEDDMSMDEFRSHAGNAVTSAKGS